MSKQPHRRSSLLGKRVATFPSLPPTRAALLLWAAVLFLTTMAVLRGFNEHESLAAIGLVTAVTLLGTLCYRQRPCRVELYQNGIVHRVGQRSRRVFWNQIFEVYQVPLHGLSGFSDSTQGGGKWMLLIINRDGRRLRIYDVESMETLCMRIQLHVAQRQLPVAMEAFRAGYAVRFGRNLSLSRDGLQARSRLIRWDEIDQISLDDRTTLRVIRHGESHPALNLLSSRIPNLAVLDGILRQTQEEHASESQDEARWDEPHAAPAPHGSTHLVDDDTTPARLMAEGFDWQDISDLSEGHITLEELRSRGPRHRPRNPR